MATLVGYWKLDELATTGTLADSINGNSATITGSLANVAIPPAILFPDPTAKAFGSGNSALSGTVTGMPASDAPQSIAFWMLQNSGFTEGAPFALGGTGTGSVWFDAFSTALNIGYIGGDIVSVNPFTFTPNVWYHVAYTYDGTYDAVYINGIRQNFSTGNSRNTGGSPSNICIGQQPFFSTFFAGNIDDIRVYTGALTAAEVLTLASGQPLPGPTITTQPGNTRAASGGTATFTVAATTSGGTLHYQWVLNGSNVGTDSSSYTTATLGLGDNGSQLYVLVTDNNGTTRSRVATLFTRLVPGDAWIRA